VIDSDWIVGVAARKGIGFKMVFFSFFLAAGGKMETGVDRGDLP